MLRWGQGGKLLAINTVSPGSQDTSLPIISPHTACIGVLEGRVWVLWRVMGWAGGGTGMGREMIYGRVRAQDRETSRKGCGE